MSKLTCSSNCEQIINLLYNLVGPMLGSHDCVKCIYQTDTYVYTADVVTLLSSLEIEPACVELMIEALQSHKQQYKRGTKSVLFMITRLAKSVFLLEKWGIPPAFAIKVIQKHILELAISVEQLAIAVPVDKTHHHNPRNIMLNGKNYFPIPSYKNEKLNESEFTNQYQSLSSNGFSSKKQTTYSHSKEEIPDFRLESNVDLHNIRIENNLVNNFAEVVGETLLHNLNKTNKSTVNHLQTEDFSSEAVDWFFEGTCHSSIEDYKVLQLEETVEPSSEINDLVPREVKENLPLSVCTLSHLSEVISKSELVCDDNSTQVIHGGTNLFSMDINNSSSSSPPAHIQCQKTVSCPASSSESTLSAIPVSKYSQSASSSSTPLAYHKILPKSIAAAENNVLEHHLSLSSLDQMLKKVGKSKLKMNVSVSSRHFQPNFTCPDQNILAQHDTVMDSIHKGKESQKLGTYSEISPDNSYSNQDCLYQIHFPDDLCYLDSCHLEMMDIVKQVYLGQITATKDQWFNPNLVDCLHVPVSLSSSKKTFLTATTASVYQGLIITCKSVDFMSCNLKGDLTTLLINADLTPSYHHIGYKPSLSRTTLVSTFLDRDSTTDSLAWEQKIIEFVKLLKVSLILVKGQASDKLITMCSEIGIYILTDVPFKTMSVLANYLHVDILTYLEQSSTASVCTLSLEPLADVWLDPERNKNIGKLYFHVSNVPVLQTLLLSSSCAMSSQLVEERLWKCLYSVASAFSDGKMLPGAGETEHWCADMLKSKSAILLNQSSMESVVVESLADVFVDFSDRVKMNSLLTSGASAVATNSFHLECKSSDSISHSCFTDKEAYSFSSKDLSKPGTELANDFVAADHLTCASHKKVCDPFCDHIRKKPIQYDNYLSKLAMWETAVDVVCMLISVGSSVLTGVSSELANF